MIKTEYNIRGSADITIAIVADLHSRNPESVLEILRDVQPDVIAVPGDLLENTGHTSYESVEDEDDGADWLSRAVAHIIHSIDYFVEEHPAIFKRKRSEASKQNAYRFLMKASEIAPTVVSLGNHERYLTEEDEEVIQSVGVQILNNSSVEIKGVLFGGIPSKQSGKIDHVFLEKFSRREEYKILLCHHPEYYKTIAPYNIDMVVSGHAHGGQIRVADYGIFSPGQGLLPKLTKGVYDNRLVVSAGCSNTAAIPRIGNPCEVVVVRVHILRSL